MVVTDRHGNQLVAERRATAKGDNIAQKVSKNMISKITNSSGSDPSRTDNDDDVIDIYTDISECPDPLFHAVQQSKEKVNMTDIIGEDATQEEREEFVELCIRVWTNHVKEYLDEGESAFISLRGVRDIAFPSIFIEETGETTKNYLPEDRRAAWFYKHEWTGEEDEDVINELGVCWAALESGKKMAREEGWDGTTNGGLRDRLSGLLN